MLGEFSSMVVFTGKSVGGNDGPTNIGSVGRGEGIASGAKEDADHKYPSVTRSVGLGRTLEKEGKTGVWSPIALTSSLGGAGVGDGRREDSAKMGVVGKAVQGVGE